MSLFRGIPAACELRCAAETFNGPGRRMAARGNLQDKSNGKNQAGSI